MTDNKISKPICALKCDKACKAEIHGCPGECLSLELRDHFSFTKSLHSENPIDFDLLKEPIHQPDFIEKLGGEGGI